MDSLRQLVNGNEQEETGLMDEVNEYCTLTKTQRLYGFGGCFILGFILSILGTICFAIGNITLFAVFFTVGNLTSIASTMFLMGPLKQLKNMFKETRYIATLLMLLFIALTLMAALWWRITILVIVFCICEFIAFSWYCLSYIPFARSAAKKCFNGCLEV